MAGLASLASALGRTNDIDGIKSAAYLIELGRDDAPVAAHSFQYFPESLSDSKNVDWQTKPVPGGSLPLYQWTGSGERSLSFTAYFTADIDLTQEKASAARLEATGQTKYNVDVRSAVAWLRRFMLPTYDQQARTYAPPKAILYLPRSGIGLAGGTTPFSSQDPDSVVCVMTQCEVTYEKFFSSGLPRIASVSLGFAQIPQLKGIVSFPVNTGAIQRAVDGEAAPLARGYKTAYQNAAVLAQTKGRLK